jgi:hypothetical protein
MTVMQERETLPGVDEVTQQALSAAADGYEKAPARLKAAILDAARKGDSPAKIVKAIRHVYTYDYVARLVRKDRAENPSAYGS